MRLDLCPGVDVLPREEPARCPATWLVFLREDERERLEAHPWPVAQERLEGQQLLVRRTWRGIRGWEVSTPEGRCAFLQPDGCCEIHLRGGAEALPSVCRRQPFRFVRGPDSDEVTVGVDWSCPEVVAAPGVPLTRRRRELEVLAAEEAAVETLSVEVELYRGRRFTGWEEVLEAETTLVSLLEGERLPLSVAVAAAGQIPILIRRFLKVMEALPRGMGSYSLSRYLRVQRTGDPSQEPFRAQVRELATAMPSRAAGRRRVADVLTVLGGAASGRLRLGVHLELLGNRLRSRRGEVLYRWEGPCSPARASVQEEIAFPVGQPDLGGLLRTYLAHTVRRRLLIPVAGLERGAGLLATLYAIIREQARARAVSRGLLGVDAECLREAIARTEAQVALSEGVATLLGSPTPLRRTLDRILRSRNFALNVVQPLAPGNDELAVAKPVDDR